MKNAPVPAPNQPYGIPVYRSLWVKEAALVPAEAATIHHPHDAAAIFAKYLEGADREHLVVLLLNTKSRILGLHAVAIGGIDSCLAEPRGVFRAALLANASRVILGHNHPSGDPTPSAEDEAMTRRMHEAGEVLGIDVLDHVIVGEDGRFVSLKERGAF
jgi:DNA repair protein RadC